MSEEQQPNETTPVVNNELTERVNSAYIASDYTLLNGGSDNVVMIKAAKDGRDPVDVMLTLEGMEEIVGILREEANKNSKDNE